MVLIITLLLECITVTTLVSPFPHYPFPHFPFLLLYVYQHRPLTTPMQYDHLYMTDKCIACMYVICIHTPTCVCIFVSSLSDLTSYDLQDHHRVCQHTIKASEHGIKCM